MKPGASFKRASLANRAHVNSPLGNLLNRDKRGLYTSNINCYKVERQMYTRIYYMAETNDVR